MRVYDASTCISAEFGGIRDLSRHLSLNEVLFLRQDSCKPEDRAIEETTTDHSSTNNMSASEPGNNSPDNDCMQLATAPNWLQWLKITRVANLSEVA